MDLTGGARCLLIGANGSGKCVLNFIYHFFHQIPHFTCTCRSTILRILSGRHLTKPDEAVQVLGSKFLIYMFYDVINLRCQGRSAFHDTRLNFERSYLDTDWGMRTVAFAGYGCPLQADIPVNGMMKVLQAEYPQRRDELIELLGEFST